MSSIRNWDLNTPPIGAKVIRLICKQCGSEFLRDASTSGSKPIFCSQKCAVEGRGLARRTFRKTCDICGIDFFCPPHDAERRKFCSVKCKRKSMETPSARVEIPCSACGKQLIRSTYNLTKTVFCDVACMATFRLLPAPGTNNLSAVKKWFKRPGRMVKCEECGYDKVPEVLVIHHKDRDRANNALGNLAVLCPTCHALEHLAEWKTGWKGHDSTDPVRVAVRKKNGDQKHASG
jgi:hypothetical protein